MERNPKKLRSPAWCRVCTEDFESVEMTFCEFCDLGPVCRACMYDHESFCGDDY